MKLFVGLIVSLLFVPTSVFAAASPIKVICKGENILTSNEYYGYLKSIDRLENRLKVTFEKYSVSGESEPSNSKCTYYSADCATCKVHKREVNKLSYRPVDATATVLCAAGSSVVEYGSVKSFAADAHTIKVFPGTSVNGSPVVPTSALSDSSCVSWAE